MLAAQAGLATMEARRPTTTFSAVDQHPPRFFVTSAGFCENVFMVSAP